MKLFLLKIIAVSWIIGGLIWLVKPQGLRNYLARKAFKKYRKLSFLILLAIGGYLFTFLFRACVWGKLVGLAGLIIMIKSFFLFNRKLRDKVNRILEEVPLLYFRLAALLLLLAGIFIIWIK